MEALLTVRLHVSRYSFRHLNELTKISVERNQILSLPRPSGPTILKASFRLERKVVVSYIVMYNITPLLPPRKMKECQTTRQVILVFQKTFMSLEEVAGLTLDI